MLRDPNFSRVASTAMEIRRAYEKERRVYNLYHRNKINNLIHAVFVPIEWFCFLHAFNMLNPTFALSMACLIFLYYTFLEATIGCLIGGINLILFSLSFYILRSPSLFLPLHLQISSLLFIYLMSFFVQIVIGHGIFEGNKPAFTNSLTLNSIALSLLLALNHLN